MTQSNSLKFSETRTVGDEDIIVRIRLNDECKNGHQDFSVTGEVYPKGKRGDRNMISCGCVHDDILKAFPEFKIFVDLHLCDYLGNPMHATANGFYHLSQGFNDVKPDNAAFKAMYCSEYRITETQFDVIKEAKTEIQFYLALKELGVFQQWKTQAKKAIRYLESLTDTKFIIDSKRTQLIEPTQEEINKELDRINSGYYTTEAEQQRELAKRDAIVTKLEQDYNDKVVDLANELEVEKQVLLIGGEHALNNCIYYKHTKQISFNWKGYDSISEDLINKIKNEIVLPDGITIEPYKKK